MVKFCILYFVLFNPNFGVLFDRTGGCTSTVFIHPRAGNTIAQQSVDRPLSLLLLGRRELPLRPSSARLTSSHAVGRGSQMTSIEEGLPKSQPKVEMLHFGIVDRGVVDRSRN